MNSSTGSSHDPARRAGAGGRIEPGLGAQTTASAPSSRAHRAASSEPAELEREASAIRADMDRTLEALEQRFAPRQLLDRSTEYLRVHGGDLTRKIGDTVKQNPMPVLLTAAGLTWLIASSLKSRRESDEYASSYDESHDYATSSEEQAAEQDDGGGLKQKLGETLSRGKERLHAGRERLREKAATVKESWRSSRSRGGERVSASMQSTRERARERAHHAQERAQALIDEQPLLVGALALAAGALLGAALPTTQYERRTMGPVRDRTLEKAKEAGERQYDHLRTKLEREDVQVSGRAN
ncbi:MAG TPA: DUF3618 domain-containing protein [Steroidobacter sp.]|jgi:ElaB/YqjD/DUF883 family membrane-anchored ribosome-binding protein|nr:DUF3618 domain-containing protein [Steroidobacteraceae bacterium]HLS82100.1 DUF3618 domain-containing protein [Steroidobacter sp.]